jgi:nitroreductase
MTVMEAIMARQSVRSYESRPVEKEKIEEVMEAARLAPSAGNRQEWRFVVVTEREARLALANDAAGQAFVGEAACVIACCADTDSHTMRCGQPCYPIDVAIAIDHLTLRAAELGLGTCWIGSFSEGTVKKILGIPADVRVVELLTLGYPRDPKPKAKNRLGRDEVLFFERWGNR